MFEAVPANERIGLFIDSFSLERATSVLKLDVDFRRLLALFRQQGRLVRANYYATVPAGRTDYPLRPLLDWLSYNGFNVVARPASYAEQELNMLALALDVAVDAMAMAEHLDHVVLVSGCREFQGLVHTLKARGCRVSVISTVRARIVADELRRQADDFIELEDLRSALIAKRND